MATVWRTHLIVQAVGYRRTQVPQIRLNVSVYNFLIEDVDLMETGDSSHTYLWKATWQSGLWPCSKVMENKKQGENNKNVYKVIEKKDKDEKQDSAGDMAAHRDCGENEVTKKLMRQKPKRQRQKEISPLWRDRAITHNATSQPINLLDQSACWVCITWPDWA